VNQPLAVPTVGPTDDGKVPGARPAFRGGETAAATDARLMRVSRTAANLLPGRPPLCSGEVDPSLAAAGC